MNEENQKEQPTDNSGKGNKPTSTPLINSANEAAERLEKANAVKDELLQREEELASQRTLGGRAEGGTETKPKEETPQEYAARVMANDLN